ncbi:MAG: AAA family ATPase [Gammaproteobacteria bacterium]|nr:AAA family ATPase [Gammaproteobacteria bacterium]
MYRPLTTEGSAGDALRSHFDTVRDVRAWMNSRVRGQPLLVERLLIGLVADGHLLVEGAPGLAKTRAVRVLADCVEGDFHRIQFTPDLLPADLTGTDVFRPQTGSFEFQPGPLFHSILLADEINRAPAKVQSALLEAMAERQVTVGAASYPLSRLFMVMATQNPIEHEGTYPLPEAQLDRFLLHLATRLPGPGERARDPRAGSRRGAGRRRHRRRSRPRAAAHPAGPCSTSARRCSGCTWRRRWRNTSCSWCWPRAGRRRTARRSRAGSTSAPARAPPSRWTDARAPTRLAGRDFVTPEDVQSMAPDILRHRLILNYEAEAEGVDADRFIGELLARVPVP